MNPEPNSSGTVAQARHPIVLPWRRMLELCWANIRHRLGRFVLVWLGIAVVVAFVVSSLTYHGMLNELMKRDDVHTRAVLARAGVFTHDADSLKRQADQRTWLMVLSAVLCLVGITNTMLMSVTERTREIGTLKCLGAPDQFVVRLFLLESLFVGFVGSVVGALVGYLLTILQVGFSVEFALLSAPFCVNALMRTVPLAVGAGTVLTVIAAAYPVYIAACMKPVDAMRVEV